MFCEFPMTYNSDENELAIAQSVIHPHVWEHDKLHISLWFVKRFTKSLMKPTKYRHNSIRIAVSAIGSGKQKFPATDSALSN